MGKCMAVLLTMTTYGTWLRGDARGWVDTGIVFPPDPVLESQDRQKMKHSEYRFRAEDRLAVGQSIGESLISRMGLSILALTVQTWHVHIVVNAAEHPLAAVVKCAKDAARWRLRPGRPIWGDGYDKRFCYSAESVRARIDYVERHNLAAGMPARPWPFITFSPP